MTTQTHPASRSTAFRPDIRTWARSGAAAAVVSSVAVLATQALAIAFWPDIALFKPLDSYARSAIFVLVPTIGATAVFAWLVKRAARPVSTFIQISAVILVLSFIPDYVVSDPHKTLLASSMAAFLHVVAGALIVGMLVFGYQRQASRK